VTEAGTAGAELPAASSAEASPPRPTRNMPPQLSQSVISWSCLAQGGDKAPRS
jgi:hypothetical protein